jgi:hypothetical protein
MGHVIASDTDSAYFECAELLKKIYSDLEEWPSEDKVIEDLLKITNKIISNTNQNLDSISRKVFNIQRKHYFELKQEVIVKKAYWSGKRRYAMWIVNKEGVPIPPDHKDALDMKGLDIMKSNFPPLFREFGEELIKKILFDTSKQEIDKYILDFRKSLNTIDWRKLLKPTGLKKLDEYIAKKPAAGEIFSKLALKCPTNTKGAIYTNDLIRFKKQTKQYETFQVGDKMYLAYLKENPYHVDVLGLNGYNDSPEILEFVEKYMDKNQMFESVMKNKLENLYQDLGWGAVVFNNNVNKFFTFN